MMRFPLVLLLPLFLSGMAHGQSLSVEAAAGPTLAYRFLAAEKQFNLWIEGDRPIVSYVGDLRAIYLLNESWRAGVGVGYARKGLSFGPKIAYSFLELPFFVRYTFMQSTNIKLYAQSGLFAGFLLRQRTQVPTMPGGELKYVTVENSSAKPVNIGMQAGVGMLFPLSGPWQIGVEPSFSSHLLPTYNDVNVKKWLFSFGINLLLNRAW